jgi:hypothetical protein
VSGSEKADRFGREEVEKVAGSTDDRSHTGRERKFPYNDAEFKCVIKFGSDGRGTLSGCIIWAPKHKIYHIVLQQIVPSQMVA